MEWPYLYTVRREERSRCLLATARTLPVYMSERERERDGRRRRCRFHQSVTAERRERKREKWLAFFSSPLICQLLQSVIRRALVESDARLFPCLSLSPSLSLFCSFIAVHSVRAVPFKPMCAGMLQALAIWKSTSARSAQSQSLSVSPSSTTIITD